MSNPNPGLRRTDSRPSKEALLKSASGDQRMTDLSFQANGTVATITVQSVAGMEWVDENVATEPWQWMGEMTFAVEPRYAPDLLTAARLDGLECDGLECDA